MIIDSFLFILNYCGKLTVVTFSGEYINEKGIKYYDDLINILLDNNITPIVTLYHWDLPQVRTELSGLFETTMWKRIQSYAPSTQILQEKYGGWQNISMVNYFNDFANLCFERFGNRVKYWLTFNNPWVCQVEEKRCVHCLVSRCNIQKLCLAFSVNCCGGI